MKGHGTKYGRRKEEAIAALLSQRSIEEAARSIGASPRTLLRWMKLADFKAAYNDARGQMMGQANARLQQGTSPAVTTLLKMMLSPDAPSFGSRPGRAMCRGIGTQGIRTGQSRTAHFTVGIDDGRQTRPEK
jgi:hypothetical protein